MPPWFISLLIGFAIAVVAYIIMPKPKMPKPAAAQDMDSPTAEAGRPIPVVFGELEVTGTNILWWGDKSLIEREVNA